MRKARGAMLFQEYKKKMSASQGVSAATPPQTTPEKRQKIAE